MKLVETSAKRVLRDGFQPRERATLGRLAPPSCRNRRKRQRRQRYGALSAAPGFFQLGADHPALPDAARSADLSSFIPWYNQAPTRYALGWRTPLECLRQTSPSVPHSQYDIIHELVR